MSISVDYGSSDRPAPSRRPSAARSPRNPRYAVEALERRLSPSACLASTAYDPGPGPPPPPPPAGPVGPAFDSTRAIVCSSDQACGADAA